MKSYQKLLPPLYLVGVVPQPILMLHHEAGSPYNFYIKLYTCRGCRPEYIYASILCHIHSARHRLSASYQSITLPTYMNEIQYAYISLQDAQKTHSDAYPQSNRKSTVLILAALFTHFHALYFNKLLLQFLHHSCHSQSASSSDLRDEKIAYIITGG